MMGYQASLTQRDIDALCQFARSAWRTAPQLCRRVAFVWRQKCFVARPTGFRLMIDDSLGHPVACVWG